MSEPAIVPRLWICVSLGAPNVAPTRRSRLAIGMVRSTADKARGPWFICLGGAYARDGQPLSRSGRHLLALSR